MDETDATSRPERKVYCTVPGHKDGEHGIGCIPPAEPDNPELRLIRAIWGLCGLCNRTDPHAHPGHLPEFDYQGYVP